MVGDALADAVIDELLAGARTEEEIVGPGGLLASLTKRLVEVGEQDMKYGECDVKIFRGAKINVGNVKRSVTGIEVVHPVPRKNFRFHIARIFVDDELKIPVRYESYDWPEKPGGPPQLLEEYTYTDIKLNNGFTDTDFDENNPNYHFH